MGIRNEPCSCSVTWRFESSIGDRVRYRAISNIQCPRNTCPAGNVMVPVYQWFLHPTRGNVRIDSPNPSVVLPFISIVGRGDYLLEVRVIYHCRPVGSLDLDPSQVICTSPIIGFQTSQ
jgi:hypothetical protein